MTCVIFFFLVMSKWKCCSTLTLYDNFEDGDVKFESFTIFWKFKKAFFHNSSFQKDVKLLLGPTAKESLGG